MLSNVTIDPAASGIPYDGHGGLSAGASSRLLIDYAPAVRDEILDYLYKPKFGASLHVCKVEIGGDTQSTDGTEPSHMHARDDLDCTRGYEWWLMKEARKRNSDVSLYALPWGEPGWVNNQTGYYGNDTITYQINWLRCARDTHGLEVDWLGLWNERPWGTVDFVKQMRGALDAGGFGGTQLVLVDGGMPGESDALWTQSRADPAFAASYAAVGLHYPCDAKPDAARFVVGEMGKRFWASEDWWSEAEWEGAACWAKLFNQNFVRNNMTSTISWSTVWSVYPVVDTFEGAGDTISGDGYWGPGLLYAWQPWSGHYTVAPTVWASAHTTQFVERGWTMPFGAAGNLPAGGSFVGFISPDGKDFTLVFETATGAGCHHCKYAPSTAAIVAQPVSVSVAQLKRPLAAVAVWRSNETHQFVRLADAPVDAAGRVALTIAPAAIYSVSSTSGQRKGAATPPAASARFPTTWRDEFDGGRTEGLGRFWADQCGSFQLMPAEGGSGLAMTQRVTTRPGVNRWANNLDWPLTVIGDATDAAPDRVVSASVIPLPAAVATARAGSAAPAATYEHHAGRIVGHGGRDWDKAISATLVQAEAQCDATPTCDAITFASSEVSPPAPQLIWLTSRTTIDQPGASGWQTYQREPPHPAPPPAAPDGAWAGVCGRLSSAKMNGGTAGVCLRVNGTHWSLAENTTALGGGAIPAAAEPATSWGALRLAFDGQRVTAQVGSAAVGTFVVQATAGMAGLQSSWHRAQFDNFVWDRAASMS